LRRIRNGARAFARCCESGRVPAGRGRRASRRQAAEDTIAAFAPARAIRPWITQA